MSPRSADMRGLGLAGVPEAASEVDEGIGVDELEGSRPIDPHRVSLPRPPTPVPEVVEHARWPPSPSHWPSTPTHWSTPSSPPPHWSTPPPASPTALSPPPRRRPLSAQLELRQIREPRPNKPSFSPLALPAELELDGAQLFRRASLPLPPRTPALTRRASTLSSSLPRSKLPRSPGHRALARLSLPDCELQAAQLTEPEPQRRFAAPEVSGLASPIHIREPPSPSPKPAAAAHEPIALWSPIHLQPRSPTPRVPTPALTPPPPDTRADTPLEPRRRCPGLPFAEVVRLLALLLVPIPLWLYWWQRGQLGPSASVSSFGSASSHSVFQDDREGEDSSDDSEHGGEEEAIIQEAWREPLARRRSTSISISPVSPRRDSLAVPSLGGIPMSREASWDGSAYSSRVASPSVKPHTAMPPSAKPPLSPPLVRRTEEGLLDW